MRPVKRRRPELLAELAAMTVNDLLTWDYLPVQDFHSALRNQPSIKGRRFRSFADTDPGGIRRTYIVRVS